MLRQVCTTLCLSLLLSPLAGCDPEAEEELELELEAELEVEPGDAQDEEEILWTDDELELAPPSAEAVCGPGHWEYKSTSPGCNTCGDGKKYNHYHRWCWDGPPACGGCGGWEYKGWSCLEGCW